MGIKPTYVTFEQAKKLKEKGFDIRVKSFYDSVKELNTIENDEMNTKGFANRHLSKGEYSAPEQWQVIEWLRVKYGIWIEAGYGFHSSGFYWLITLIKEKKSKHSENDAFQPSFSSPHEATSAAIDYILDKLI